MKRDAPRKGVPKFDDLMNPTLQALKRLGGSASIDELVPEIVKFLNPKKSIFNNPIALSDTFKSKLYISYWVITLSVRLSRDNGVYSVKGLSAITTPAAWVLACRATPSTLLAKLNSFLTVSSLASS